MIEKKSWIEENYPIENFSLYSDICLNEIRRDAIEEVCQKILEEVEKLAPMDETVLFSDIDLKKIIKYLGVEIWIKE